MNLDNVKISLRHDVLSNWVKYNPVLLPGEIAIVDSLSSQNFKIGDGVTNFDNLQYVMSTGNAANNLNNIRISETDETAAADVINGKQDKIMATTALLKGNNTPGGVEAATPSMDYLVPNDLYYDYSAPSASGVITAKNGCMHRLTLTSDVTVNLTYPPAGKVFETSLIFTEGSTLHTVRFTVPQVGENNHWHISGDQLAANGMYEIFVQVIYRSATATEGFNVYDIITTTRKIEQGTN